MTKEEREKAYLEKFDNMWSLDDNYKIQGDDLNVTLYKKRECKKPGKVTWGIVGYFRNAKLALKRFCTEKMNNSCGSAEELMEEIDALYDLVEEIGRKLNEVVKEK